MDGKEEQDEQTLEEEAPTLTPLERQALRDELRQKAKAIRADLPAPYRAHKSAEICKKLNESLVLTLGITGTKPEDATIGVYAALSKEVNLDDFIAFAYEQGCKVAFPCMMSDAWGIPDAQAPEHRTQQTMEMRVVSAEAFQEKQVSFLNHPLKKFAHDDKALEPFPYVAADELLMIVVPVVGFDAVGNRLGYGAGNYDRYLAQIPDQVRVIGVAFSEQQVDDIPTEEHDVPMTIVSL